MSLRKRTIIIATSLLLFMIVWISVLDYKVISSFLQGLEENEALKDTVEVSRLVDEEQSRLEEKCKIYASSGIKPDKIDEDLVVAVAHGEHEAVYSNYAKFPTDYINASHIKNMSGSGIVCLDEPILIAAHSYDNKTLIIGEKLEKLLGRITKLTGKNVALKEGKVKGLELRLVNSSYIVGLIPLKGLDNSKSSKYHLEVGIEREIYAGGTQILRSVLISLLSIGLVLITAFILILDRSVLSRISNLTSAVIRIKETGNFDEKVRIEGGDELSELADRINEMLEEVKRSYELKYTNETLRLINRIMRHDMVNNLSIIWGSAELLKDKVKVSDEAKEYLESIFRAVERCENLINRMREFERCTSAGERKRISVRKVVEEVVSNYGIEFSIEGDCEIEADDAFASVIDNLVTNAIIHGRSEKIEVAIERKGEECEVRFADFGKGIPDEIKDYIFEEGFKFGETGNTGLGLHIVKKVIEKYGGSIEVADNKPDGTVFIIKIKSASGKE